MVKFGLVFDKSGAESFIPGPERNKIDQREIIKIGHMIRIIGLLINGVCISKDCQSHPLEIDELYVPL